MSTRHSDFFRARHRAPRQGLHGVFCRVSALALALALPGCGGAGDLVELRLYPCMFGAMADMPPASVRLTIDSFDGDGASIEQSLTETFSIDDPSAQFSDGYATVGYRKPDEVVSADFRVVWLAGDDEQAVVHSGVAVPDPGGAVELISDGQCAGGGGETTEAMTTDATTEDPTTGSTTGDPTTGSTGSSTSDGTVTGTSATTEMETTTETTGPEDPPVVGEPCDPMGFFGTEDFCWTAGYGEIGTFFRCSDVEGEYLWVDITSMVCDCAGDIDGTEDAGCSGNGYIQPPPKPYDCLCKSVDPDEDCNGPFSVCNGVNLMFCDEDGYSYMAYCDQGCIEQDGEPICAPNDAPLGP